MKIMSKSPSSKLQTQSEIRTVSQGLKNPLPPLQQSKALNEKLIKIDLEN